MKTFISLFSLYSLTLLAATPKNLIYIIADGMGPSVVTATRIYARGSKGGIELDKFKQIGLVKTYSADDFVTDSAASATALATGVKTFNKAIGVDSKKKNLKTVLDYAREKNLHTGIITTTSITHATPASFYAHHDNRNEEKIIAAQLPLTDADFVMGGGSKFFNKNLLAELTKKGFTITTTKDELAGADLSKKVIGLYSKNHLPYKSLRVQEKYLGPDLSQMVQWGIKHFKNIKKNYVLIVEAGRIDHALHDNDTKNALDEAVELNETINKIRSLVDPETLIVVTSDHDTGGIALSGYGEVGKVKGTEFLGKTKDGRSFVTYATGPGKQSVHKSYQAYHTAADVLIFSEGNGSENFGGVMNNTDIFKRILKSFNW